MLKLAVKMEMLRNRVQQIRDNILNDEKGVTSLEYALVATVLVGVVSLGFTALGDAMSTKFAGIGSSL